MRGRQFTKRFARRPKPPVQWIGGVNYGNTTAVAPAGVLQFLLAGEAAVSSETKPLIERFRVERIVGDIAIQYGVTAVVTRWSFGVIVIRSTNAQAAAAVNPNPEIAADAQLPWVWLHHQYMTSNTQQAQNPSPTIHVDIRQKRIIHPDEGIFLVVVMNNGVANAEVTPYLRTLVSRVA